MLSRPSDACRFVAPSESTRPASCTPLKMQCIMITGDNPLTAVHVAKDVEIVDRDVMILDLKEGTTTDGQSDSRIRTT